MATLGEMVLKDLVAQREAALALHLRPHRCHDERGWLLWFDADRLCLTARALGVS